MKVYLFKRILFFWISVSALAVGAACYLGMQSSLQSQRSAFAETRTLLAKKLSEQLAQFYEQRLANAEAYYQIAMQRFKSRSEQIRFIEGLIQSDASLLAFGIYQKEAQGWRLAFHLSRPHDDPKRIDFETLKSLHQTALMDLDVLKSQPKGILTQFAKLQDETPVLRVARSLPDGSVLGVELDQEWVQDYLKSSALESHILVTNERGLLVLQTETDHFVLGEDLSYLPAIRHTMNQREPAGWIRYREFPGEPLKLAGYNKEPLTQSTVMIQEPYQNEEAYQWMAWRRIFLWMAATFSILWMVLALTLRAMNSRRALPA